MELRYLGFDQSQNARAYRFDVVDGAGTRQMVVTVDLTLFMSQRVGIQEGPSLCARKLTADLESHSEGAHELTVDDLHAFAEARDAEVARKADARRNGPKRSNPPEVSSPWRNSMR